MKHVILDTEQEAILRATLSGVASFLAARATRRDPFRVISKAAALQERKCANLLFQLDQPPLASFDKIEATAKGHFVAMLKAYLAADQEHMRAVLWTQILALMLAQRADTDPPKAIIDKLKGEKAS